MNKILIIFALFFSHFFHINAQKDKLDQLFEKYQETDGVTSIKIAKPMFSMLNKLNINDSELDKIKPLLSKINGLKIMIIEENPEDSGSDKPAAFYKNLSKEILTSVNNLNYEELMTVNSRDSKIKFLSSEATNGILNNLLLNISSEGNTVLMMLDGKISMDDVNKLIEETNNFDPVGDFDSVSNNTSTRTNIRVETSETNSTTNSQTNSNTNGPLRNVGKFSGVSVSSGVKVFFTQGNNQSVVVDTDPNMQEYVNTVVKDDILYVSINSRGKKNLNFKKLNVNIEAPKLSSAKISSGSQLNTMNTINSNEFKAEVTSGANLNADLNIKNNVDVNISSGSSAKIDVKANSFELQGSSGSMSTVVGSADKVSIDLSSAAGCNAQNLVANQVNAQASSGAVIKIHANESLTATSSSGSSIRYKGNPTKNSVKESSGGSIKSIN